MAKLTAVVLFLAVCVFCCSVYAAGNEESGALRIGLGVLYSTRPWTDVDARVYPVPLVYGRYKNFYADGRSAGYILNDNESLEFSIAAKPRLMGYEADDSPALEGMDERDWSIDAGLRGTWENDYFKLEATALTDILAEHDGQELSAVFSKELWEGFITPRAGIKWLSGDLVDHYYGVKATEELPGRPEYIGSSTVNFVTGFTVAVPFLENWTAVADFEYEGLGSEITDSPIVEEEGTFTCAAGALYKF